MSKEITEHEYNKRMKCHAMGFGDKDSAMECFMSKQAYRDWRISEGLPINSRFEAKTKPVPKVRGFKPEHVADYKHNNNAIIKPETNNDTVVIVDVKLAEKYATEANARPVTYKLEDRVKARLHSKELHVDAKRSFGGGGFTRVGF